MYGKYPVQYINYDLFWPDFLEIFKAHHIHVCFKMGPFRSFYFFFNQFILRNAAKEQMYYMTLLHIEVRLPILLCAVKTVEGDFRFLLDDHSKCRTNSQRKSQFGILYMVCTLNDIYKQYNKLHEHWYTKISSLRCVADRNPPQNASDLYTKYWSYAEHCRPCTRLSGVNWWKQKQMTLIVPIGYSLVADHRSVPSSGPGFV